MTTKPQHRLHAGYTWEALHAVVTHFGPRLETVVTFDTEGRTKIRYQLKVEIAGQPGWAPIAESFYSLRKGWQYALPEGTPQDIWGAGEFGRRLGLSLALFAAAGGQ